MISCALKGVNLFGNQLLVCSSNRSILRVMTTTGYNDPYKILGIEHDANETTIKSAYIRLVKKYHPDKNTGNPEANETFIRVQNAYRILMEKIPKEERSEGDVPYSFTVSPLGVESESHPRWFENPGIQAVILFTLFLLTISVGSSALLAWKPSKLDENEDRINRLIEHYKRELIKDEILTKKVNDAQKKAFEGLRSLV